MDDDNVANANEVRVLLTAMRATGEPAHAFHAHLEKVYHTRFETRFVLEGTKLVRCER